MKELKKLIKTVLYKIPYAKEAYKSIKKWYLINCFVPKSVRLEASTLCQLRCSGCSFQNSNYGQLGGGYLTFENFKKFIDKNKFIKEIELSNYGEIFLNPDLVKIMKYAYEKGVILTATNGCNFNTVSEEQLKALVETKFSKINLSIDGASQDVYKIYRRGGNFDKVIENVKKLQELKEKFNSPFPELGWQYVIMEHNELEIRQAKEKAEELGIPIFFKLIWDRNYVPKNPEYIKKETGLTDLTRDLYENNKEDSYLSGICRELFFKPQINWDGRVLGCCEVQYANFDINAFDCSLKEVVRSEKYRKAKQTLLIQNPGKKEFGETICYNCQRRLARQRFNKTLEI